MEPLVTVVTGDHTVALGLSANAEQNIGVLGQGKSSKLVVSHLNILLWWGLLGEDALGRFGSGNATGLNP